MQILSFVVFCITAFTRFHNVLAFLEDGSANLTSSDLVISAEPHGKIDPVMMYQSSKVTLSMRYKECLYEGISCKTTKPLGDIRLTFQFENKDSWALELMNESVLFTKDEILRGKSKDVFVYGEIIGFNNLEVYASQETGQVEKQENEEYSTMENEAGEIVKIMKAVKIGSFELVVIKTNRTLNKIFTVVLTLLVVLNTINMGAHMEVETIKQVLKKPIGPAVGFVSQFLVMPCLSFAVGYLLFDDALFRLGLFVMGCCPGGNASNFWCKLLGGDLNLSVTMTTISTVSALGMMPLWMYLLGSRILVDENIVVPYDRMIITLILLIGPVAIGVLIKYQSEKGATYLQKITTPFTVFVLLFNLTVGIYAYLDCFKLMTGLMVAAGFLIAFFGFGFGALFAWVFRLNRSQIVAVSIETAFQNGSIAFILLQLTLDDPKNDIATIAPIAQIMLTALPLWGFLIVWKIYQRIMDKKGKENVTEKSTPEEGTNLESKVFVEPM